jgi:alpha-1,3-glucosyltransferase
MLYLAGFPLLHLLVTVLPLFGGRSTSPATDMATTNVTFADVSPKESMGTGSYEFLPLLLTSVYCAVGLVWAFLRLGYAYVLGLSATV